MPPRQPDIASSFLSPLTIESACAARARARNSSPSFERCRRTFCFRRLYAAMSWGVLPARRRPVAALIPVHIPHRDP